MTNDLQEFSTSEHSTGTYGMGHQLEDKLFDVYDTFCQVQVLKKYILTSTGTWKDISNDNDIIYFAVAGFL